MSVDKYFSHSYYFLFTTSLYESKFTPIDRIERKLRFNNNYIFNLVGGKEITLGKKKNSSLNINLRASYAGGQWYTPIDTEASREEGYTVRSYEKAFTERRPDYMRADVKIGFRRNKKKTTRIWEVDIQNVSSSRNVTGDYWDTKSEKIITYYQLGILPVINYRIEF